MDSQISRINKNGIFQAKILKEVILLSTAIKRWDCLELEDIEINFTNCLKMKNLNL